jgi:hypothetical protein
MGDFRSPAPVEPFSGGVTVPPADLDMFRAHLPKIATPTSELVDALLKQVRHLAITAAPPANVRPTAWSQSIDLSSTIAVAAVVGNYAPAVTLTIPKGYTARIEQYGVHVTNPAYTYDGTLLWAFRKNGSQLLGFGMSNWGEQRGSMVFPRKVAITLMPNDTLEFMVRRALLPGPAYQVQMGFRGWLTPMRNTNLGTQAVATTY